jgi:hypothetical protein
MLLLKKAPPHLFLTTVSWHCLNCCLPFISLSLYALCEQEGRGIFLSLFLAPRPYRTGASAFSTECHYFDLVYLIYNYNTLPVSNLHNHTYCSTTEKSVL